jgi:lipid-A-disaccharide synthase
MTPRRIFITVAEVSGDRHAAQLIHALRSLDSTLIIEGLGGPEMAAAGATIHRETVGNAAMGWRGALRAFEVMGLLKWTRKYFQQHKPDLQIGVDSPSMNFHFAKLAKGMDIPVMQYVAPQLWAWREGRMEKVRKWIDRLACILPFEEEYFRSHRVNATFVGHPLFDAMPPRCETSGPKFPERPPVVGLLPGSRRSEAQRNFPGLLRAAELIKHEFPNATFLVPTTAATHPVVEQLVKKEDPHVEVDYRRDAFDEMVPRCDLCLTVSGTATLHVAGFGVPMIVVYRASRASWNLLGRWLIRARTYSLVNVLAAGPNATREQHVVSEFIPWFGDAKPVAELAVNYLKNPEKLRNQRESLNRLVRELDSPGASLNVARMALALLEPRGAESSATAHADGGGGGAPYACGAGGAYPGGG